MRSIRVLGIIRGTGMGGDGKDNTLSISLTSDGLCKGLVLPQHLIFKESQESIFI